MISSNALFMSLVFEINRTLAKLVNSYNLKTRGIRDAQFFIKLREINGNLHHSPFQPSYEIKPGSLQLQNKDSNYKISLGMATRALSHVILET